MFDCQIQSNQVHWTTFQNKTNKVVITQLWSKNTFCDSEPVYLKSLRLFSFSCWAWGQYSHSSHMLVLYVPLTIMLLVRNLTSPPGLSVSQRMTALIYFIYVGCSPNYPKHSEMRTGGQKNNALTNKECSLTVKWILLLELTDFSVSRLLFSTDQLRNCSICNTNACKKAQKFLFNTDE